MLDSYIDIIKNSPLFYGMEINDITTLLECLAPKLCDYNKNEFIINSSELINKFGIVLEGEVIITKENSSGNRSVMTIIKKCGLFGEMFVFSSLKTWPVTVMAQTSCKVLFLTNTDLITRCSNNCSLHNLMLQNFIKVISDKALFLNKKVEYLSTKSIRGKISLYLIDQLKKSKSSTVKIPLKRNELADFLNVSRPSMSRELCLMRDEGILDFHLSTFEIKDLDALKLSCE